MKITYDKEADAAYIYVKDKIMPGEVKKTLPLNDDINVDFDKEDKLLGIEVLNASKSIQKKLLQKCAS